jgi:hypothetical protein
MRHCTTVIALHSRARGHGGVRGAWHGLSTQHGDARSQRHVRIIINQLKSRVFGSSPELARHRVSPCCEAVDRVCGWLAQKALKLIKSACRTGVLQHAGHGGWAERLFCCCATCKNSLREDVFCKLHFLPPFVLQRTIIGQSWKLKKLRSLSMPRHALSRSQLACNTCLKAIHVHVRARMRPYGTGISTTSSDDSSFQWN